jgi:hypothetical protein
MLSAMSEPKTEAKPETPTGHERELLQMVVAALEGLRYGSVLLTVHDGRVVEIQRTEKLRVNGIKSQA